ncbi:hypothetical protein [Calothrix sp. PCC 7507]|uniref:hypothetical protein n=1 Tax=Calothrix sp. PCC 7507 TaxID=99598 RepID=UPI00029F39AE|nr:hypothetical protein [Calothrix sp. PCC 7507]AFY32624.1 hypothetical protein Cal7507_2185 [Calothrix sp. PCC 7507]
MNPIPDSFEHWRKKISSDWHNIVEPEVDDNYQPLDDEEKLRWLRDIDHRHLMAMPNKLPGKVSETILQEFIAILQEYKKLQQVKAPHYSLYTVEDLRFKIANVIEDIADIYNAMCDPNEQAGFYYKQASFYYHQAIQAHTEKGSAETAKCCRQKLTQLRLNLELNVNLAIEYLLITLESLSPDTLESVENLIDLGEIYSAKGDEFEAEKYLLLAENKLKELGHNNPSSTELADSLMPIFVHNQSEEIQSDLNNVGTALIVRELYRRLYFALSQIYREKAVNEATKYLNLVDKMDGYEENKHLSEQMLSWLNSHFNF